MSENNKDTDYNIAGILKAKRIDNNEWVYGFYSRVTANYEEQNIHYITTYEDFSNGETVSKESFEIDPKTLCRASGLRDVEGNVIWEHDIVTEDTNNTMRGLIVFQRYQFAVTIIQSDNVLAEGLTFPLWQYDNCEENGNRVLRVVGNEFDCIKTRDDFKQKIVKSSFSKTSPSDAQINKPAYSAMDIAKCVINECIKAGTPVSNVVLNKILYLIQEDFLTMTGTPLFEENFCAAKFGPYIPDVYWYFVCNGAMLIRFSYELKIDKFIQEYISQIARKSAMLTPWEGDFARIVSQESPWNKKNKNALEYKKSNIISKNEILDFVQKRIRNTSASKQASDVERE